MAEFNIPDNQQEVLDRTFTDIQNALPTSNPRLKNSLLFALADGISGRTFDFYLQLNVLIEQLFMDTANNDFLERWGSYKSTTRNPATQSVGNITATGTVSSSIPLGTTLQDSEGNQFTTTTAKVIGTVGLTLTSLTRSGSTVTGTTTSDHGFATGIDVVIAGAVETQYNGTQTISVTGATTFTYEITTTPSSPATGTITATVDATTIPIISNGYGEAQNLLAGTELTFTSPIAGVDNTAYIQYDALSGGTDIETDADYRDRVIDRYQNPIAQFNKNQIVSTAKSVSGVTRVFPFEAGDTYGDPISVNSITRSGDLAIVTISAGHDFEDGMAITISGANEAEYNVTSRILKLSSTTLAYRVLGSPASPATGTILVQGTVPAGQVIIFFTRDNDDSIIPSGAEVAEVDAAIQAIRPVNTAAFDCMVLAPTAKTVNFTFTALNPNTVTMQAAITANLQALFQEETEVSVDLPASSYISKIASTIDPETGERLKTYSLSTPTGDITVLASEIPVLGTINYP